MKYEGPTSYGIKIIVNVKDFQKKIDFQGKEEKAKKN